MICSGCGTEIPGEDLFCESCGLRVSPPPAPLPACLCGAPLEEADADGYCPRCGRRVCRPPSDHVEQALSPDFAGVSDRGLQHERNEDRFALIAGERAWAAVVCDGVSSTRDAEVAAAVVADTVAAELRTVLASDLPYVAEAELLKAIETAGSALAAQTASKWGGAAPSTTVVAALLKATDLTVAWAGDSRAYWIGESDGSDESDGILALTEDHSWLQGALRDGQLSEEEALASPQAHGILRWVGADADPEQGAEVRGLKLTGPGALLLCTDGLWNYASDEAALRSLLEEARSVPGADAAQVLQHLVAFALGKGGRDNVTAVLLRWTPPAAAGEPGDPDLRTGEGEE